MCSVAESALLCLPDPVSLRQREECSFHERYEVNNHVCVESMYNPFVDSISAMTMTRENRNKTVKQRSSTGRTYQLRGRSSDVGIECLSIFALSLWDRDMSFWENPIYEHV